ncbi:MAG: hypothetical protein COX70_08755 [Flavobacteriales bacterium CG_4_10_14_0_2_um_filter_32_8]|nr:MAG: hypothetical protein COX70_08755 [Flavobacteriales bacterium CG_4_10_14_0_2_um_filter_32_8]
MKKLLALSCLFFLILLVNSCGNEDPIEEVVVEKTFVDDGSGEVTAADTSSTGVYQEEVNEHEKTSLQDAMKQTNSEEMVGENGISFCDCIKKQKELSDLMLATEDDAVFDKAMADLEALKNGDCKFVFSGKQNTIDEKKAHERKVKNCLGK